MDYKTIPELFLESALRFGPKKILKYKSEKGSRYLDLSWAELKTLAEDFAAGLVSIGMEAGDRVAILSYNRLEWVIADLGTMLAGGVNVPIYHTSTADQTAYIIKDSGAKFIVVEDKDQLEKVLSKKNEFGQLSKIILIKGKVLSGQNNVVPYVSLLNEGGQSKALLEEELTQRRQRVRTEDLATIVYTSGTTGPPKGCMISHKNTAYALRSIDELLSIDVSANLSLLVLPLSHFYPRMSGYYYNIYKNVPFAIAESIDDLARNIAEVGPTYFCSVPRILEKTHVRIVNRIEKGSPFQRVLFQWAAKVGSRNAKRLTARQRISWLLRAQYAVAHFLVFRRIKNVLGGRLWFVVCAGAPLSPEVGEFIQSLGIQVLEFYGLTETIGGTMTTFDDCRIGTVGKPMPGFEVQLAEDGEILIRGNNFMGYYNRPDLTRETLRDGWCYTGDMGRWDDEGRLIITDRKKDLIITSGGKNIAPQNIENMIKTIPLVSNAMVYGDKRKYLTALITLDREEAEGWAGEKGLAYSSYEDLTQSPEIRNHIQTGMDQINKKLARFETIKRFAILPRDFSQDEGEITPTLKVKRKTVTEKYKDLLDSMYENV